STTAPGSFWQRCECWWKRRGSRQESGVGSHSLHVPKLALVHAEVMAQFVNDGAANLLADFRIAGAHSFDVLLVEHHVVGPGGQIKDAFPGGWDADKLAEQQSPRPERAQRGRLARAPAELFGRQVFDQHRDVLNVLPELFR